MKELLLQDGTTLDLQGTGTLDLQNEGNPVVSPVPIITPGSLGAAAYPSFFPCPSWEYSQDINGHLGRTLFDSGWVRQRRTWREQNTSVNLTFVMPTTMFDRWNLWMVNNGYEWFTMYLDRFAGEKVLTEVRLVAPISWEYAAYDVIRVSVSGELGKGVHEYGPQEGPLDGENEYGGFCVPVYLTDQLQDTTAYIDDVIVLAVDFNEDATTPVSFDWYEDNILIPGESGPSLTYTVPKVGDITEEQKVKITVNVSNDCGSVWSTSIITIPPDPACAPYSCDALREEMRYRSQVTGFGVWDLMDPNYYPTVPQFFRRVSTATGPGNLTSDKTGSSWDGTGLGRTTQIANDADLCDTPYIMRNTDDAQEEFFFSDRPSWGSNLPNISMAVAIRNVDVGVSNENPDNFIFAGGCGMTFYTQTGQGSSRIEHNIRIAKNAAGTEEHVFFNFNLGLGQSSVGFPLGTFSSNVPKLLEVALQVTSLSYVASDTQPYTRDVYNMICDYRGTVWLTDSTTGNTTEISVDHEYRVAQVFSLRGDKPAPGEPMPDAYKPVTNTSFANDDLFLQGGIGGMYNLSINGDFGGQGDGSLFNEGGAGAGRVGSSIHTAFMRNYVGYTEPGYCSLPENTTRVRRRT